MTSRKAARWMTRISTAALAALALSAPALAAHGQSGPCKADAEKLCPGQKWGEGLGKCLKEHQAEISSKACVAKLEKGKEHVAEFKQACGKDIEQHCGDVKRGEGRVLSCLKSHSNELSLACKGEMEHLKAKARSSS